MYHPSLALTLHVPSVPTSPAPKPAVNPAPSQMVLAHNRCPVPAASPAPTPLVLVARPVVPPRAVNPVVHGHMAHVLLQVVILDIPNVAMRVVVQPSVHPWQTIPAHPVALNRVHMIVHHQLPMRHLRHILGRVHIPTPVMDIIRTVHAGLRTLHHVRAVHHGHAPAQATVAVVRAP